MSEKTVDKVLLNKTVSVVVGEKEFKIGPLVRAKYQKLINVLAELALQIDREKLDNPEKNINYFITLISDDVLMKLYEVALDRDKEWINNNLRLNQELKLFAAILEINDIEAIVENFIRLIRGKVMAKVMKQYQNLQ